MASLPNHWSDPPEATTHAAGGPLRRVVVVGSSCSGKTTFARALAALLGSTPIELDALHWGPDWTPKTEAEFRRLADAATSAPCWVADGNYRIVRDIVWPRATSIVWLNLAFPTVFGRALRRTLRRSLTAETLFAGNRESLARALLSRESILLWVLQTHGRRRREFRALRDSGYALPWYEFRRPAEAAAFLHSLQSESADG
jgi:adenylate kinase family enzyme